MKKIQFLFFFFRSFTFGAYARKAKQIVLITLGCSGPIFIRSKETSGMDWGSDGINI